MSFKAAAAALKRNAGEKIVIIPAAVAAERACITKIQRHSLRAGVAATAARCLIATYPAFRFRAALAALKLHTGLPNVIATAIQSRSKDVGNSMFFDACYIGVNRTSESLPHRRQLT